MHFTSEQRLDDGVIEREFTLGEIPGILWTPGSASASAPVPLILLGHPPLGLRKMYPRLAGRARHAAAAGFAAATIELPGSGDRPRWAAAPGTAAGGGCPVGVRLVAQQAIRCRAWSPRDDAWRDPQIPSRTWPNVVASLTLPGSPGGQDGPCVKQWLAGISHRYGGE